jgi:hypothetical protein
LNATPSEADNISRALQQPGISHFLGDSPRRVHYLTWGERGEHKPVLMLIHGYRGMRTSGMPSLRTSRLASG